MRSDLELQRGRRLRRRAKAIKMRSAADISRHRNAVLQTNAAIERAFRFVEMIGVAALVAVAVSPTSRLWADLIAAMGGGVAAGHYSNEYIWRRTYRLIQRWDRQTLTAALILLPIALVGGTVTTLLARAIMSALSSH